MGVGYKRSKGGSTTQHLSGLFHHVASADRPRLKEGAQTMRWSSALTTLQTNSRIKHQCLIKGKRDITREPREGSGGADQIAKGANSRTASLRKAKPRGGDKTQKYSLPIRSRGKKKRRKSSFLFGNQNPSCSIRCEQREKAKEHSGEGVREEPEELHNI